MPLSEEELRLLEQMERALVAEDPKFASTLRGTAMRRNARRRAYVAAGVFVVGIVVLMTGAVTGKTVVGVVGFVVMVASAYVALSSWKGQNSVTGSEASSGNAKSAGDEPFGLSVIEGGRSKKRLRRGRNRGNQSMMQRFEERWRRRRDQNGGF